MLVALIPSLFAYAPLSCSLPHAWACSPLAEMRTSAIALKMAPRKPSKPRKKKLKKVPSAAAAAADRPPVRPTGSTTEHSAAADAEAAARDSHMAIVRGAVEQAAPKVLDGLAGQGFAVVDDFLPTETVLAMRAECESLRSGGRMEVSKSSRWDASTNSLQTYDKHNVLSTNLAGGAAYHLSPRLVEYCVSMVSSLPPLVNQRFPEVKLSDKLHTNKLAVCLGDGSKYDKHYDNEGGDDLRKLTCLIYLQETWEPSLGGCFRMFADAAKGQDGSHGLVIGRAAGIDDELQALGETSGFPAVDIAPLGGRLLCFWSDTMVHGVLPSFAASEAANRWALTVWLQTDEPDAIHFDPEAEGRHFESSASARGQQG
jgi:Rps23 Pro-64 3,4-dihydroxylase Tpa1-like proline 4-hydroxylase